MRDATPVKGGSDRGQELLAAVGYAADQLLRAPEGFPLTDVFGMLGTAAGVQRVALVAALAVPGEMQPRMEVRHQWTSAPTLRLHPGPSGWHPYFARWRTTLERGDVVASNVAELPPAERALLEADQTKAIVFAPVIVGDRWYGHLSFGDAEEERSWSPEEVEVLRAAARIVGCAIGQRSTQAALERRSDVLRTVAEIAIHLLDAPDWRESLGRLLEQLRTATRARSAWLYVADPAVEDGVYVLVAEALAPGANPASAEGSRITLTPEVMRRMTPGLVLRDEPVTVNPGRTDTLLRHLPVATWIAVPVMTGRRSGPPVGALGLDSEQPRDWSDGEVEGLRVIACSLAAAVQRQAQRGG